MTNTTPRRSLIAAVLLIFPAPWIALDLAASITEYRILRAWSVCSEKPGPSCLASEEANFDGPYHVRRSALQRWQATDNDGQTTIFNLQPGYAHYAGTLPGPGQIYRVDDEVVAVMKGDSTQYAPTALSGSHAITVDSFALLTAFGIFATGLHTAIIARRKGLAWSERVGPRGRRRVGPEAAALVGAAGLFTTFLLGLTGTTAWTLPLITAIGVVLYPVSTRLIRQKRGTGRHAA